MANGSDVANEVRVECGLIVRQANNEVRSRARRGANLLRNAAMEVLAGQRAGRRYKLPHKRRMYQASAPGEPPAVRTGNLRRNWRQEVLAENNSAGTKVTCRITSDMPYAKLLENGTDRMAARPYAEKIKNKSTPEIKALFTGI